MNRKTNIPIRYSEMGALIYIAVSEQPVSPAMISTFLGITKPSATAILKILDTNGYIERSPSKQDKRSYTVLLTEKGQELADKARAEYCKAIELVHKKLGEEDFVQLISLISQANRILKKHE